MSVTVSGLVKKFGKDYKDTNYARIGMRDTRVPRIPFGLFALDLAIGGGFPEGRCMVIYGTEASCKTTLCYLAIAAAQRKYPKKTCVFFDLEGHFDADWAMSCGVDVDKIAYIVPPTGEHFVDMCEDLMYAKDISLIVADSLAALVTSHELDSDAEKAMVGNSGILINKFYRKIGRALSMAKIKASDGAAPTLICVNQIRMKIGVMHGSPETQPGGNSFKYASSLTVRVSGKDEFDKEISDAIPAYKLVSATVQKQKVGISARNSVTKIALMDLPKQGLHIGQSYDWNTICSFLKDYGFFAKHEKKGWDLTLTDTGEILHYDVQDELKKQIADDHEFGDRVREQIFDAVLRPKQMIYDT
jgi:protein RecA